MKWYIKFVCRFYRMFMLINDYESLLTKMETATMAIKRLPAFATETPKTVNNMNPCYTRGIFIPKTVLRFAHIVLSLVITKYGDNSLKAFCPKIWNQLLTA